MQNKPVPFIALFAAVFFVLTWISDAGFFGAIVSTIVVSVIVYFVMQYLAKKKTEKGPPV